MITLITIRQAAEWSGINYDTLRSAACKGVLRSTRRGRRVLVSREEVLDYAHRRELTPDLFDAEWLHFTDVCNMSTDEALTVLSSRYRVTRQALENRLRRRRDCGVLA